MASRKITWITCRNFNGRARRMEYSSCVEERLETVQMLKNEKPPIQQEVFLNSSIEIE